MLMFNIDPERSHPNTTRKESLVKSWAAIRTRLVSTKITSMGYPEGAVCSFAK